MIKSINVNELQAQISKVTKEVESGAIYAVMRYSKPVAVMIPYSEYENMRGNCRLCMGELKSDLKKLLQEKK